MADEQPKGAIPGSVIGTIGQVNTILASAISLLVVYRQARAAWQQQNPNTPSPFPPDQELINLFSQDVGAFEQKAADLLAKYGG